MNLTASELDTINRAANILAKAFINQGISCKTPETTAEFCKFEIAHLEYEVFGVLFLDNQHRLITYENMFRGTIHSSTIYPREVAKAALLYNAAAVIFTHNHPGGTAEPSPADRRITKRLVNTLSLLDIRVLDHIVVSNIGYYSFAETGLL